jgi:hypothetical protein
LGFGKCSWLGYSSDILEGNIWRAIRPFAIRIGVWLEWELGTAGQGCGLGWASSARLDKDRRLG